MARLKTQSRFQIIAKRCGQTSNGNRKPPNIFQSSPWS